MTHSSLATEAPASEARAREACAREARAREAEAAATTEAAATEARAVTETPAPSYAVAIAGSRAEVRAAQRLRRQVFGDEMGAALHSSVPGLDVDDFDALADHLIVSDTTTGDVVGTYRLLPPGRCERAYSDAEFDLGALRALRPSMIEAGRSCVHPAHRTGAVIHLMWSALARYVLRSGHRYLAGCASVPLADGGRTAASAWKLSAARHTPPAGLTVTPHHPWSPPATAAPDEPASYAQLPPLFRGYLRLGAWVCGPPAHDPEFGVADFYVLLDLERMNARYRRAFLGESR